MRKIYTLILSATFAITAQLAQAQCTIDNSLTTTFADASPKDAGVYCQDAPVDQVIQIITIDQYLGQGITAITINGISNAPDGLTSNCDNTPCVFTPSGDGFVRGCVTISGTPTVAYDDSVRLSINVQAGFIGLDTAVRARFVVKERNDPACVVGLDNFEIASGLSIYPNPANGSSNVNLNLPEAAVVRMAIYDVLGNKVSDLHNGYMSSGDNSVKINGLESEQGMYLLKVEIDASNGTNTYTERLIIE